MINNIIKKLPLTSDIVFKRVFSREGNEDILKALLEAILEIPIQDVTVKNPELPRNLYESKAGVLDVKVEIDKDKICDIEMQVKDLKNIDKRSTYYMSKILSDELKKSEDYIAVKNTIVINLLNFEFYKRNSYHSIAHMKFEKTKENEYIDMGYQNEDEIATKELEMHFIEIPKFIKKNPKATTKLEQWLWLIAGREEKLEMAKEENKEIKKAMDIIDEMSMDEKEWELYESRKMAIMDYNTGIIEAKEEGIIKGQKQKQIEIAKELLKMNMNIDNIQKVTKLTKEEIEKLKS
jgi:predicted transposase/invertase (TIGR01784 family)